MKHTSLTIGTVVVLIVLVFGALYLYEKNAEKSPVPVPTEPSVTEYRNEAHAFTLSYPSNLAILEYTDDIASIGHLIEGGIDSVADIRTATIEGKAGESFTDAATRELENLCAADGPEESFSCTSVDHIVPFVSASGDNGFEVYLTGTLKTRATGETRDVVKGPFFAFVLSTSATTTSVLIVHAPLTVDGPDANQDTVRAIASSIRID